MAIVNGWGRGTWGQLTWGQPIPVTLSAPGAGTSALGTISVVAKATVSPSGLSATIVNGGVAVDAAGLIGVNGFAGVSALGTATTISNNSISVSGLAGTAGVGSIVPDAEANVSVTGQEATGAVGSPTTIAKANQVPIGQAGTSALGTATTQTDNRYNVNNLVAQMNASNPFVNPSFNCKANVTITGVSATGELGTPFKWQEIDDSQTPNWTEVAA